MWVYACSTASKASSPPPEQSITCTRRQKVRDAVVNDSGLRFGLDVTCNVVTIVEPAIVSTIARGQYWRTERYNVFV
jgi:hypothetical protein